MGPEPLEGDPEEKGYYTSRHHLDGVSRWSHRLDTPALGSCAEETNPLRWLKDHWKAMELKGCRKPGLPLEAHTRAGLLQRKSREVCSSSCQVFMTWPHNMHSSPREANAPALLTSCHWISMTLDRVQPRLGKRLDHGMQRHPGPTVKLG